VVRSQPGEIVRETLSQKTLYKNKAGGVAQGEGPEFKPQYHKKKKTTTLYPLDVSAGDTVSLSGPSLRNLSPSWNSCIQD
jgi:hypothetical protein